MHVRVPRNLIDIAIAWLVIATALVLSGGLAGAGPWTIRAIVLGIVAIYLVELGISRSFRDSVWALDPRAATLVQAWRLPLGSVVLVLGTVGALPPSFAGPAGWGDVAVGALALILAPIAASSAWLPRQFLLWWNALGLADLAYAMAIGTSLAERDPASMALMYRFPLALVPLFGLPLSVLVHLSALVGWWRGPGRPCDHGGPRIMTRKGRFLERPHRFPARPAETPPAKHVNAEGPIGPGDSGR